MVKLVQFQNLIILGIILIKFVLFRDPCISSVEIGILFFSKMYETFLADILGWRNKCKKYSQQDQRPTLVNKRWKCISLLSGARFTPHLGCNSNTQISTNLKEKNSESKYPILSLRLALEPNLVPWSRWLAQGPEPNMWLALGLTNWFKAKIHV